MLQSFNFTSQHASKRSSSVVKGWLAISGLALLSACSGFQQVQPGTSYSELVQRFGMPQQQCQSDSTAGGQILNWSGQPIGRFAWTAELDEAERVVSMQQMLSDTGFAKLNTGDWDQQRVACWFGRPALIEQARYQGKRHETWTYRYLQPAQYLAHFYIYFDESGQVRHFHPGPDPLEMNDGWFFRP